MNDSERFKVLPGTAAGLKDADPAFQDRNESHEAVMGELQHYQAELRKFQELLDAERRGSLLICLQAMDTGGKDGTINHVLGTMNPQGCRVVSFEQPSAEEAAHDHIRKEYHSSEIA